MFDLLYKVKVSMIHSVSDHKEITFIDYDFKNESILKTNLKDLQDVHVNHPSKHRPSLIQGFDGHMHCSCCLMTTWTVNTKQ